MCYSPEWPLPGALYDRNVGETSEINIVPQWWFEQLGL